jgi:hypothetical protein
MVPDRTLCESAQPPLAGLVPIGAPPRSPGRLLLFQVALSPASRLQRLFRMRCDKRFGLLLSVFRGLFVVG